MRAIAETPVVDNVISNFLVLVTRQFVPDILYIVLYFLYVIFINFRVSLLGDFLCFICLFYKRFSQPLFKLQLIVVRKGRSVESPSRSKKRQSCHNIK